MASIIAKHFNGRSYYYYAESRRVDGKPRIVAQRYLGTAEEIATSLGGVAAEPQRTRHFAFGDVAAVWRTIQRLALPEIVDEIVGRQRAAVSVGTHVALAVLHKATGSALPLRQWWETTAADRFIRVPAEALDHGRFRRAVRRLGPLQRRSVEERLAKAVNRCLGAEDSPVQALAVDIPDFASSVHPAGWETRPCGVSLLVSRDGTIPLVSEEYRGDCPDGASFSTLTRQLTERYEQFAGSAETTIVFPTARYLRKLPGQGLRFVGGLVPEDYPELLALASTSRKAVDKHRLPGLTAVDTRANVGGSSRRVIVVHSTTLHAAQARNFAQTLANATRRLGALAEALKSGTVREPREYVQAEIARITRVRWLDRVVQTALHGTKPGKLRLEWRVDESSRLRVGDEFFGKQLVVTDQEHWPVAEVITAFRARYHLDSTFRQLSARLPYSHTVSEADGQWNEERVAVSRFLSVLTTAVVHLMRHEATRADLDLSVRDMLTQLAGIREIRLRYPSTGGRPRTHRVLADRNPVQQRLFELFDLDEYAPRR